MKAIRRSKDRGHANHGWLDSYHTFSFADYYDPDFMGFRDLRVINEDFIEGGKGFPTHGHRDMEIVTYVIEGQLAHKDTLGNAATISPGEVQRMSAGTGIQHSEFNSLVDRRTHLLQIWLLPRARNLQPGYEQKQFQLPLDSGLTKVVSGKAEGDQVSIQQDVDIYVGKLNNSTAAFALPPKRYGWVQLIKGELKVLGEVLEPGDAMAISEERELNFSSRGETEFLLFDLA